MDVHGQPLHLPPTQCRHVRFAHCAGATNATVFYFAPEEHGGSFREGRVVVPRRSVEEGVESLGEFVDEFFSAA